MSSHRMLAVTPLKSNVVWAVPGHLAIFTFLLALTPSASAQNPAVTIQVNTQLNRHPINPLIYGVAYYGGDANTLSDLNAPLNRLGGNNTSRYNWQVNADNRGEDFFFESISAKSSVPGEVGDTFFSVSKNAGAEAMLTIPMIGWVGKLGANRTKLASFSIAKYGPQTLRDSQFPDAGNGIRANGQFVTGNDPNDASTLTDSSFQQQYVFHLVSKWGTATDGGVKYYILDNEHSIWYSTHRDVHPTGPTGVEIRDKISDYAAAIRAADPGALIAGPEEWGWTGYLFSGFDQQYGPLHGWSNLPDRTTSLGGMDYLPWLLSQWKAAGTKPIDVFSVHYYPQGGEYRNGSSDTSSAMQLRRNRSTRSLWDPNYVDETWINDKVQLIPRLKQWVQTFYYPSTPVAVTEYNWGAESHINGATTQADIYGIFGRESLDMATRWITPAASTPTYKAMKMYRNYDGNKSTFGDVSVSAAAPTPDTLAAFAAIRSADGALTVMVINKALTGSTPVTLSLANFSGDGVAQAWQLTSANAITRIADVNYSGSTLGMLTPPQSVTLFVLPAATVNRPPVASFTATPTSGAAPLAVSFNAGASSDPDGSIAGYAWSFGDGSSAAGVTASHTYTSAGAYTATLTVTDNLGASGITSQAINVSAARTLTVTPATMSLVAAPGSTQAVTQSLSISAGSAFAFTASAATTTGGGWLSVNPTGGSTPQSVTVAANPSGLGQGVYSGSITVTVASAGSVTVPITLTIASTPTMSATPNSLSFDYSLGSATPATQTVALATSGVNISFVVTFATQSGGNNWLTVTPASGVTPSTFTVGVNSSNIAPGTYTAKVTITSSASNNSLLLPVTFTVRPGRQVLSQIADGAGWKTSIILVNLDDAPATFILNFYTGGGSPLRLGLEGAVGKLESLQGTIAVGGSRTISTLGADTTLSQGWADLTSTRLVNGLAVFRQTVAGRPDQEAGVPATTPSALFVLPFDNTSGFVSSMALVNTNASNARAMAVSPRDESGTALAGDSLNLPSRGQTAVIMSDRFPAMALKRGVAEFNSPAADFSALGLRFNPGGAFTSLPTLEVPAPGTRPANQVISQIADGSGWKTSITLVNLDNVPAPFTLRFWRDDGTALSLGLEGVNGSQQTLDGTIPVGGARTIFTTGLDTPLVQGWVELVTTRSIGGVAVFRQRVTGRPDQEAAAGLTTSSSKFVLPFDNTQNFVTSMAITNVNQVLGLSVNVIIRDEAGNQIGSDTVPLPGRAHTAFALPDRFPATRNQRGVMEFSAASGDITGLGLRFNPGGAFTSFPILMKP